MATQEEIKDATFDENSTQESETSKLQSSRLEQIHKWRQTLQFLVEDKGFDFHLFMEEEENNESSAIVISAIEYLDKINALVEDDDFLLSESGFLKYKEQHTIIFEYISSLEKVHNSESIFYFASISKHIQQKQKKVQWKHSLAHFFVITPGVIALLIIGIFWTLEQTQNNILIKVSIFWFISAYFRIIFKLLTSFKKNIATPLRFKMSLIGVYSLAILRKVFFICVIPIILTLSFKHYWVDDIVIITLFLLCFFHYDPKNIIDKHTPPMKSIEKESPNA